MILTRLFIFCYLFFGHLSVVFGGYGVAKNLTTFLRHRGKRGLIFNNGGALKLVMGPIFPITLADPIAWRSLICLYNIHVGDYKIPSFPLYPWDKWENLYVRSNQGRAIAKPDESREFLYLVLENYMSSRHGNGRECMLRSICENAQIHNKMDLFGQILNIILTPGKGDVDPVYNHAYEMGKAGVDCFQYYNKCPPGPIQPITLADPIVWRSLICSYNIHVGNYNIPSSPLYPWDKWENFYVRSNQGRGFLKPDASREFLYSVLENYMTSSHGNGRECLLRSICENAQIHYRMDLFGEVLNVILTPGKGDVDAIYNHAYQMGKAGVDCFQYYSKCPKGLCFIDQFLYET